MDSFIKREEIIHDFSLIANELSVCKTFRNHGGKIILCNSVTVEICPKAPRELQNERNRFKKKLLALVSCSCLNIVSIQGRYQVKQICTYQLSQGIASVLLVCLTVKHFVDMFSCFRFDASLLLCLMPMF